MERMKIRNPKIKKWRGLLILALIGAIITVAMEIYLSDHALTPDQISKKGQYCAVTSRWMSDAFATETMNGEDTYDYFLVLSEDSDRFFMIRSWTDDEQCLKYIDSLYESGEYEKIDQEWTGGSQPVDDEVKNYAIQYVSEYLGMNLTTDMYDDYFYSYCMDLTSMGDMDTVIGGMLLMFALLLIGLLGCLISAIGWHGRIAALKRQDFFPKFEQNWMQSGEKMDTLQVFHPERMADRILGMGDVVSLVERAQEQFDEEEARKLKKKLVKNQFNFNDFIGQIQQIKKMGNLKDLASMLPGMGKMLKNVDIPDDVFKQTEAIISSMTPAERERPEIINARRRERIAKGSGTTMADVNRLMKQFEDTRKMMKAVAGGGMKMPKMPGMRR